MEAEAYEELKGSTYRTFNIGWYKERSQTSFIYEGKLCLYSLQQRHMRNCGIDCRKPLDWKNVGKSYKAGLVGKGSSFVSEL